MARFRLRTSRQAGRRLRDQAREDAQRVASELIADSVRWQTLAETDPHDAADILEEVGDDAIVSELLSQLSPDHGARILDHLRDDLGVVILETLPTSQSTEFLAAMDADEAADLCERFAEDYLADVFEQMDDESAKQIRRLLRHAPDSAGGLMTSGFASLPTGITAGEALEAIRRFHEDLDDLSYVYVTDEKAALVGVISFRDLVFRRPDVGIDEVMVPDPVTVGPSTDREEVAELSQRYNLFAIPVVDAQRRLLGVVDQDALLEAIQEEASEDFAAAVGAGAEETVYTDIGRSVRQRAPWLLVNLGLAFAVVLTLSRFESIIEQAPILAILMPVVALLGGNAGAQSLAVTIRALSTDDVPRSEIAGILGRQASIGTANGILIGTAAGLTTAGFAALRSGVTFSPATIGLIVGLAAFANLVVATVSGSAIPLTFRALGLDPALASNIFLTLITDLVGFAGFLAVGALLLPSLTG